MRRRRILRSAPIVAAALLLALAGGWFSLRDSDRFAVRDVQVRGASGPDAPKVEAALQRAAMEMTTLNADSGQLRKAVSAYPTVQGVELDRDLPNGLKVTVLERRPVAVVETGGRVVPLAADGRLLQGATPPKDLPSLALSKAPGSRVRDARGRRLVALVAAAPPALRHRALRASVTDKGLTMSMERGPDLFFGSPGDLQGKWKAAARVLADPSAEGATYVDVRVPERAVAGGLAPLVDPEAQQQATPETAPGEAAPQTPTPTPSPSTGA